MNKNRINLPKKFIKKKKYDHSWIGRVVINIIPSLQSSERNDLDTPEHTKRLE
jgi:hypothetical protein